MSTTKEQALRNLAVTPVGGRRIVAWADPPASANRRERNVSHYQGVVRALVSRPGTWAQLDDRISEDAAYQFALSISNGRTAGFRPPGAFEAAWEGRSVWVRYVAEMSEEPLPANPDEEPDEYPEVAQTALPRRSREPVAPPDTKGVFAL